MVDAVALMALGAAAGFVAGLLGVGGGILFVPALALAAGLTQVEAEATSLLAMVPVALVGAYRQHRYGNVRRHDGALVGILAVAGTVAGVALANVLSDDVLRVAFAVLMLFVAAQLARRGFSPPPPVPPEPCSTRTGEP